MKLTVMTADEQFITLDVDPEESQQLVFNGNEMTNEKRLSGIGIKDGDLVMMMISNASSNRAPASDLRFDPDGSAVNPGAFQQHVRNNSNMISQLLQI
ncbi:hypothetical protein IFM89_009425 [Coptis chinensis]|uniref:Ubiquitin-like domain-containing protein n=1 Tax=Coptis chinensis TaxID=261450 RepID=A0A835GVP9_9MAGN|nr:hypothetical protein IFM89_009425 [Coptis chinensis]